MTDCMRAAKEAERAWMTDGFWNRLADAMIAAANEATP